MREYFCGWYFKCQSSKKALAIIPALHRSRENSSSSIQLITSDGVFNASFPYESFCKHKNSFSIDIENNHFSEKGIDLCLSAPDLKAVGSLKFGAFSPIKYDIMGPFKYVPFMECRHSVVSMKHTVTGKLEINGVSYFFDNDMGYIEGDRGYSFPRKYAWTQCFFENGSIMLSVASIPIGPFSFTGVIGIIMLDKKEYRLATYLGAKIRKIENGEIIIEQGKMELSVKLINKQALPLFAPVSGAMNRTIHESLSCRASYSFINDGQALISFESDNASFEYEFLDN
ncbi:MAG: hypothetical protein IJ437_01310 [Clostridia bacterium]|nr:hypothetical protein [Clostridia bacterium]